MPFNPSFSSKLMYDPCAYNKRLTESTSVFTYNMYDGKFESCAKCVFDHYVRPFDADIIDADSELRNITRPASNCPSRKYNPKCKKTANCVSTYDKSLSFPAPAEICPITFNNLKWHGGNGIRNSKPSNCKGYNVLKNGAKMVN
jgi:hypothetical protein